MRNITGVICACAIYKGCGPSARLELPPDDFSRNAPVVEIQVKVLTVMVSDTPTMLNCEALSPLSKALYVRGLVLGLSRVICRKYITLTVTLHYCKSQLLITSCKQTLALL